MACNIGGKRMQIRRARHRGFNALRDGSRFFVTENAAVSDRLHARRNFQFPNLLNQSQGWLTIDFPDSVVGLINTTKLLIDVFFTDDELEDEDPWNLEDKGCWDEELFLDDEEPLDEEEPLVEEEPLNEEDPSDEEEALDEEELDEEEPFKKSTHIIVKVKVR